LAFISQCAGAEWGLDYAKVASITAAVFAGEFIGGLFWGPVADQYGRRKGFMLAVAIISMAGIFSGASPNYPTLIFLRATCGFGVGGLTIPFDLLAEFMPAERRGEFLMKMEYFWTGGSMFVTGLAWMVLSSEGWRVLTYATAIPVIVASIFSISLLPESPRWLMEKGHVAEAEKVLLEAAEVNGTPYQGGLSLLPLDRASSKKDVSDVDSASGRPTTASESAAPSTFQMYKELLQPENVGYSYQLWIMWFCFGLTYYGIILFVSRIYSDSTSDADPTCTFKYEYIFGNACSELPGIFLCLLVIDPWGRPKTLVVTYALSAFGVLLLGLTTEATAALVVGLIGRAAIVAANSSTWVATPELYKTDFRGTGHASCNAATRVGGFCAPYIVDSPLTFASVGVILFSFNMLAGFTSMLLPDMQGLDIDSDIDFKSSSMQSRFLFNGYARNKFDALWYSVFGQPPPTSTKKERESSRKSLLDSSIDSSGTATSPLHGHN